MKKFLLLALLACIITTISNYSQQTQEITHGLSAIDKNKLMQTVEYLSCKDLGGRLSGSAGYDTAAKFMADQFASLNLTPAGDDGFMQYLNVEYNEIGSPCRLAAINSNLTKTEYKLGNDFVCRGFTGSGDLTAPVAFCGYGISSPDLGYDDYSGIDVNGKVVMVFKSNPAWEMGGNNWGTNYPREKSFAAANHGAVGILFVSTPNSDQVQKTIGSVLAGDGAQNELFPQLHIDLQTAENFLNESGFTLSQLQSAIDDSKKPFSISLATSAEIEVHAVYTKERRTENVMAILEGSDPLLKNQYIVIGAHLDHVGSQANKIFFPGANDNASGASAVLHIAKAFAGNNVKIKRSIIFVLFAGEELGLNGAFHFVNNPPVPLNSITAMLNLDCIAHGDSIMIGGGGLSKKLWNVAFEEDKKLANMMVNNTWPGGGADATPFFEKGIPTLYFVTTNSYTHLHYMTDTPETLNPELYEKVVKLCYATAYRIVMGDYTREEIYHQ